MHSNPRSIPQIFIRMSLIKLPCILIATIGMHHTYMPPNVPTKGEQVPPTGFWDSYVLAVRSCINPVKVIIWAIGIAEAAAILACSRPSSPLSKSVLSALPLCSNSEDFHLTLLSMIGVLLITLGSLLREYCYRTLTRFFTFEVSIREGHKLITTGPYGVVRHPSYSGILAIYVGMFCWFGSRGSWLRESGVLGIAGGKMFFGFLVIALTGLPVGLLNRMSIEDEALEKAFGREWTEWARSVPYSLVPGIY